MSKSVSNQLEERVISFVSKLLSKKEESLFKYELAENEDLQSLVLEYEQILHVSEDAFSYSPTDEQLESQRLILKGQIQQLERQALAKNGFRKFIKKIKQFLLTPQPAWAVISYIFIAVMFGRFIPVSKPLEKSSAVNVAEILREDEIKRLQLVTTSNGNGQIHFVLETGQDYDISGGVNDPNIQRLLYYLLLNDGNPGKRLKAVKLLQESRVRMDAQAALVSALLTDPNPGVRIRSIEILEGYEATDLIIDACIKVLLEDKNEAVRQYAMGILSKKPVDKLLPVLQIVSTMDDNEYIRTKAKQTLAEIHESFKPDLIEVQK